MAHQTDNRIEYEADKFAAYLLMPTKDVKCAFDEFRKKPLNLGGNYILDFFRKSSRRTRAINFVRKIILPKRNETTKSQIPTGLEIIHCPKKLSACLEMQFLQTAPISLQAHYIIPKNDMITDVLQVQRHDEAVPYLNTEGQQSYREGRVVIMLVGESGPFKAGKRLESKPLWLSKWQLRKISQ